MKNNSFLKKSLVSLATVAIVAMMVATAFAHSYTLAHVEPTANFWTNTQMDASIWARGSLIYGNDANASFVTFYFNNMSNSASYVMAASIYNASGGKPIAGEEPIEQTATQTIAPDENHAGNSGIGLYNAYNFTFSNSTYLNSSLTYCVMARVNGSVSGDVRIAVSQTGPTAWYDGGWQSGTSEPLIYFYTIPTEDDPADPDLPTAGGYDYTDWDTTIAAFTGFMVPLVLMLLPTALLCLITRRVDKWLIIIGLAIGSALLYLFMGAQYLWLVFLVVIGLVGMAYQSVRGGG